MSEEKKDLKKELKKNECCEGKEELSLKELEQVNGGKGNIVDMAVGVVIQAELLKI